MANGILKKKTEYGVLSDQSKEMGPTEKSLEQIRSDCRAGKKISDTMQKGFAEFGKQTSFTVNTRDQLAIGSISAGLFIVAENMGVMPNLIDDVRGLERKYRNKRDELGDKFANLITTPFEIFEQGGYTKSAKFNPENGSLGVSLTPPETKGRLALPLITMNANLYNAKSGYEIKLELLRVKI